MECTGCFLQWRDSECAVKRAIEFAITQRDSEMALNRVREIYRELCPWVEQLIKESGG
jgi:hypothetical protein